MAFEIFPLEIWDMIVLELEKFEDVLNIYNAFPELQADGVLFKTRQIWLFEKVIPHILQQLDKDDFLSCRQVCREWSQKVDNFLENHPTRRAYNHQGRDNGGEMIWEASSNYYTLSELLELNVVSGSASLRKFSQAMIQHPPTRNPFIGRGLKIIPEYNFRERQDAPDQYWTKVSQLLERFGEHIWFLKISLSYYSDDQEPCDPLMRILPLLPNLKGLSMSINSCDWYTPNCGHNEETPIPKLPQLETLEMDCSITPEFMDYVGTPHAFSNLRKLSLSIYHVEWWKGHFNNLSRLTELTIQDVDYESNEEISDLLLSLKTPELFELKIVNQRYKYKVAGAGISSGLRHFPKLSILELSINYFPWLEGQSGEVGKDITSVKSLILHDFWGGKKGISLGFLGGFPCIEFVKLYGSGAGEGFEKDVIVDRDIWSVKCPKLKEITVVDENRCSRAISCSRTKYDYLNNFGTIPGSTIQ